MQSAKMAVAASAAWAPVGVVWQLPQSFIAPYAAVFVMSATVYRSFTSAAQQIAAISLGVVLAFVAGSLISPVLVALAVAVLVGALFGQQSWLGASGIWVAVTALLMLTSGTAGRIDYLAVRVGESVLGACVGIAINALVFPPLRLRDARTTVQALGKEVEALLGNLAEVVRQGWDREDAQGWLERTRSLDERIHQAHDSITTAHESLRLNPRFRLRPPRRRAPGPAAYKPAVRALQHTSEQLQFLAESLVDASDGQRLPQPDSRFAEPFASLLEDLGQVAAEYVAKPVTTPHTEQPDDRLTDAVRQARQGHENLTQRIDQQPSTEPGSTKIHTALLLAVERALNSLTHQLKGV